MKLRTLDDMIANAVAFDVETHRVQPGLLAPPLVCASVAAVAGINPDGSVRFEGQLLDKDEARRTFEQMLDDETVIIVGANIAYDMLVMAVDAARRGIDLMPKIYAAYEAGRVYDILIAQALDAVANGHLGKDPSTGKKLTDPLTGKQGRYSLAICVWLTLGRKDAKANDKYRNSYALLEYIPIPLWPLEARTYPVDDAVNTLECALAQCGLIPRPTDHVWPDHGTQVCTQCGIGIRFSGLPPCRPRCARFRNLHDLANQVYSHWAMHLGAAWGFTVDQSAADELEKRVMTGRDERAKPFLEMGILKWKKEKGQLKLARDMGTIKRMVARAYGCSGECPSCAGRGKVISPKAKLIRCPGCYGRGVYAVDGVKLEQCEECAECAGVGKIPNPKQVRNCEECGATGLDLTSAAVPRTDPESPEKEPGVGTGRDVLSESGDELLINFAAFMEDAKIPDTYLPWLREARMQVLDENNGKMIWKNIPLCLKPNVLLETGRTSYGGVVQLLPRHGGVRECIVARPGYVFCSVDYEAGELITHAESCIRICGFSEMAEALLRGDKLHNAFAATVLGMTYEQFQELFGNKDRRCVDTRQAAKPANFGFPGRMGPVKLVLQQRKQGPDTPCPNGTTWIEDENGVPDEYGNLPKIRGYKGLRFCVLMGRTDRCGETKVTSWNDRPCPPTCKACIECAVQLKAEWLKQWPENVPYFAHVGEIENGSGEVVQHVSERIRGGLALTGGNAIANGYFQGLLADAAKSALRRVSRECYDASFRLADGTMSPLYGSRVIVFAHDEIIAELPEHIAHEAAFRLSQIMVEELQRYCPHLAKACKAEPALMRRWYKGAIPWWRDGGKKPKNDNDRLVPWEPKQKKAA